VDDPTVGVAQADTHELLVAYRAVLDRMYGHGILTAGVGGRLSRLRPTIGVESHLIEHVQASIDRFSRAYRLRQHPLWVAFRPLMWGFHIKRVLLNEPHAAGKREAGTELSEVARKLDVRGREEHKSQRPVVAHVRRDPRGHHGVRCNRLRLALAVEGDDR
jgi:hypothetical protein